jgi:hypothetical protein
VEFEGQGHGTSGRANLARYYRTQFDFLHGVVWGRRRELWRHAKQRPANEGGWPPQSSGRPPLCVVLSYVGRGLGTIARCLYQFLHLCHGPLRHAKDSSPPWYIRRNSLQ